jgi:hypothetical protein
MFVGQLQRLDHCGLALTHGGGVIIKAGYLLKLTSYDEKGGLYNSMKNVFGLQRRWCSLLLAGGACTLRYSEVGSFWRSVFGLRCFRLIATHCFSHFCRTFVCLVAGTKCTHKGEGYLGRCFNYGPDSRHHSGHP